MTQLAAMMDILCLGLEMGGDGLGFGICIVCFDFNNPFTDN